MKAVGSNITKISKIQLYYGEILDALILTYETPSGPVTKSHGGTATGIPVTIDLSGKRFIPHHDIRICHSSLRSKPLSTSLVSMGMSDSSPPLMVILGIKFTLLTAYSDPSNTIA